MAKATEQDYIIGIQTKGAKESTKDLANFAKELRNLQKITNKLELKSLKSIWKNTGWSKDQIKQASVLTRSDQRYDEKNLSQREAKRQTELQVASWQLQRNVESEQLAKGRLKTEQAITDEVYQQQRARKLSVDVQQQEIDGYNRTNARLQWMEEHLPEIVAQEKRRDELNNRIAKATGKQQTGLQKLGNTFKRIGFYRIARLTFSTIERGLSQGVSDYAKFDSGMNNTMSQLQSSARLITSSIGMLVGSLMQMIAPLVQTLGNSLAKISNGIAAMQAKQKGVTKYTRINLEYWEEYNKEVNKSLLSFDKFETLSGNQDKGPFEIANISEADNDIKGITDGIQDLVPILTIISSIGVIKWIMGDGPSKFKDTINGIFNIFSNPSKLLLVAGIIATIYTVLDNVIKIIRDIQDLVANWDSKSVEEKVTSVLKIILRLLLAIAAIVGLVTKNYILLGTATAITVGMGIVGFAEGGVPDKGSLFYAGESGAELVHSMPSGNTGVTNVAQFKQAMVEAIYECSDVFYGGEGNVVLNLDGAEVARSRRFKAELNRTNSGLNLV